MHFEGIDGFVKKRENLSFGEEELCIRVIGKKQEIEIGDFTEHVKPKDEKVEALCLHLMNSELESKRLRSCIEGLSQEMSQLRHNNTKLQSMVNDTEKISGRMKANGEAKTSLEHFLDETFQLQRYIVATGQKLMEIQSKIASGFIVKTYFCLLKRMRFIERTHRL